MTQKDHIINAWKSERYRTSLSDAERDQLPAHPAGIVDLTDEELGDVAGGAVISVSITCTSGSICISVIVSCVFTCDCTSGCNTPIFPCIPMAESQN